MVSSLLFLLLVAFVVRRLVGGQACWGCGLRARDRAWPLGERNRPGVGEGAHAGLPAARVETPLESLQRRFAGGDLTIEQYETEVGRLYGLS